MKKYIIAGISAAIIAILVFGIVLLRKSDKELKNITTYSEFREWITTEAVGIAPGIIQGGNTPEEIEKFYTDNRESLKSEAYGESLFQHYELIVMVVEITEDFKNYDGSSEQEAIVKKVIKGTGIEEGKEITVLSSMSPAVFNEENEPLFAANYGFVIPKPGDKCLIVAEESEISENLERPQYRMVVNSFTCLNLENDKVAIAEENPSIDEILDCQFYVKSELDVKYVLEIKHEILRYYGVEEEPEHAEGDKVQEDVDETADRKK